MKQALLLTLIFPLLLYGSCTFGNDTPSYTTEEVILIAREFSPECRKQKLVDGSP